MHNSSRHPEPGEGSSLNDKADCCMIVHATGRRSLTAFGMTCRATGSALISALFIMTLVAIAATAMSTRLQLDIYRTHMTLLSDKIYLAGQAVTFWAMSELSNKANALTKADAQGKVLELPKTLQNLYPDMQTAGSLYDLQARFNLNNLQDKKYFSIFLNLLDQTLPKISLQEREAIAMATRQWISPWQPDRGQDEYMNYYLKQKPPYYPGQQLFSSVSEFRLVRDVSDKVYQTLGPFITAVPETVMINFNTASRELLQSSGPGLSSSQVSELVDARGKDGLKDLKTISPILKKLNLREELFTVKSTWFLSVGIIKSEDLVIVNYAILKRDEDENGKLSVQLLRNSINTL